MENSFSLAQLKWRSRRSMLELDLILGKFISTGGVDGLDLTELDLYANLLNLADGELLLLLQQKTNQDDNLRHLINKICLCRS